VAASCCSAWFVCCSAASANRRFDLAAAFTVLQCRRCDQSDVPLVIKDLMYLPVDNTSRHRRQTACKKCVPELVRQPQNNAHCLNLILASGSRRYLEVVRLLYRDNSNAALPILDNIQGRPSRPLIIRKKRRRPQQPIVRQSSHVCRETSNGDGVPRISSAQGVPPCNRSALFQMATLAANRCSTQS
jgi:hypothetical protein